MLCTDTCTHSVPIFYNVFSECRKCYFRDPNFKNFLRAYPQTPLVNSCLRYSANTFGDRILSWGEARKMSWALWQFRPTTEESLKNALINICIELIRKMSQPDHKLHHPLPEKRDQIRQRETQLTILGLQL